jgi:WD40 repeat protein
MFHNPVVFLWKAALAVLAGLAMFAAMPGAEPAPAPLTFPRNRMAHNLVAVVAVSRDGKMIASGGRDSVKLWDPRTRRLLATLPHDGDVKGVAFNGDGSVLASACRENIQLWDLKTQKRLDFLRGHTAEVLALAIAPDGKTLASAGGDRTVRLWDMETRKMLAVLQGHEEIIWSLVFAPDGKTLASGSQDATIRLWDVAGRKESAVLRGHADSVASLAISPDGKTLVSGSTNRVPQEGVKAISLIKVWDLSTRKERTAVRAEGIRIRFDGVASSLAFSPDGKTLVSGVSGGILLLWDATTWKPRVVPKYEQGGLSSLAFLPDGRAFVTAESEVVRIRDSNDGAERDALAGYPSPVNSVGFDAAGEIAFSCSDHGLILLWNVRTGKRLPSIQGGAHIRAAVISPDGKTVAATGADRKVRLWETATGKELAELALGAPVARAIAFTPDGRTLAVGQMGAIRMWDVATRKEQPALKIEMNEVHYLAFSPDGKRIAVADARSVELRETEGKVVASWKANPARLARPVFSPDGKILAIAAADGKVLRWNLARLAEISWLRWPEGEQGLFGPIAFSPDGKTLALCSGRINLMDLWTRKITASLEGHIGEIRSVAFSPDGKTLLSGGSDGAVYLWDISPVE